MNFQSVLDKYRQFSFSERDKGDRFERLIKAYLQTDPTYSNLFNYVWLWDEFPSKMEFGGKDVGIDIVARTYDGDYWAIQCKCFQEKSSIDKPSVDSFLSTSSRQFTMIKMKRLALHIDFGYLRPINGVLMQRKLCAIKIRLYQG